MRYILSLSLSLFIFLQPLAAAPYPLAFDPSTPRTHASRVLTAIALDGSFLPFPDPDLMYGDLTAEEFVVQPGQTVQPSVRYAGQWMNTYIYIDLDDNGQFDVQTPGPQGQLQQGNELVCFSGMGLEGGSYNSAGQSLANLSGVQPPAFTIPEDLQPGVYMMRWKIDWNNCDPAGRVDEKNSIITNGGAIVDVRLRVTEDPSVGQYQLIFADEFDQPDGSRPDANTWHVSQRRGAAWNRWISDSPDVAFIQDGHLVCRAIPNPDTSVDDVPMLTGAVETRDRFSFTYGKVEVRLRTNPYQGNFPAAWMMPQPPCEVWPNAGEIDIFEAIDAQNTAYHTIHSHWSYDLKHKSDPPSSFSEAVTVGDWHVYGVEWLQSGLLFTVDGNLVGIYPRSAVEEKSTQGQWPFTHPFYLILNQSVGNGSWAKAPDTSHTYETLFDYVRVYQKKPAEQTVHVSTPRGTEESPLWYDLSGRPLPIGLPRQPGLYISHGRKILVR